MTKTLAAVTADAAKRVRKPKTSTKKAEKVAPVTTEPVAEGAGGEIQTSKDRGVTWTPKTLGTTPKRVKAPEDRYRSPLVTKTKDIPVQRTMRVQSVDFELTESDVLRILRTHVINELIPAHYAASRKAVPPHLVFDNLAHEALVVPMEPGTDDEYDPDGKYCVTLDFRLPDETPA